MLAFYVLFYNEKSVPFYYQFVAFVEDFLVTGQKGEKKPPKEKVKKNNIDFKKYKKDLEQMLPAVLSLPFVLYIIQLEIYAGNIGAMIGLGVIAGLLVAFVVVKLLDLASKLQRYNDA